MTSFLIDPYRFVSAAALWTPAQITTELWLDAADTATITTSGSEVTQINDKSGNSRNFTGTSGSTPLTGTATQNGLNVLAYTDDVLTSQAVSSTWKFLHDSTGSSSFAVVQFGVTSNPNNPYMLYSNNGGSTVNIGQVFFYDDRSSIPRSDTLVQITARGVNNRPAIAGSTGNDTLTANSHQLLSLLSDPANAVAAERSRISINGGVEIKSNTATDTPSTADPTFNLQIGGNGQNTAARLTGELAELVIVSGIVSAANRERFEGYLAHKWGLTANLPAGHPYKSTPPYV